MAIIYLDSCGDHMASADFYRLVPIVTGISIITGGRNSNCYQATGGNTISVGLSTNITTSICGIAVKHPSLPVSDITILRFIDNTTIQFELSSNQNGAVSVKTPTGGGGSLSIIGTSSNNIIRAGTFQYIETKVVYSTSTTGSILVKIDGNIIFNLSNIQTAFTTAQVNRFLMSSDHLFDDLYIADATGSTNNDLLGDMKVLSLFPIANGRVTQFGRIGVTNNWQAVDDSAPDSDTTYVYGSSMGLMDMYRFGSLPSNVQTPVAVQTMILPKKDLPGNRSIASVIGNGTTESISSLNLSLWSGDYIYWWTVYDINPITGVAWTVNNINNIESGVKITV